MSEVQEFNIALGDRDPELVVGRAEAVARAKELSNANSNMNVSLESADGMISMQFRDGVLEVFVTETREKGKARPRRERTEEAQTQSADAGNESEAASTTSEADLPTSNVEQNAQVSAD